MTRRANVRAGVGAGRQVLRRNVTSVSGFWFDCITSIPWSYLDYAAYLVRTPHPPLSRLHPLSVPENKLPPFFRARGCERACHVAF